MATGAIVWLRKILKGLYSPVQSYYVTACCNYWSCKEERRAEQSSRLHFDSFLEPKEVTEQTAVNCTVDVTGKKM